MREATTISPEKALPDWSLGRLLRGMAQYSRQCDRSAYRDYTANAVKPDMQPGHEVDSHGRLVSRRGRPHEWKCVARRGWLRIYPGGANWLASEMPCSW